MTEATASESKRTSSQTKTYGPKRINYFGEPADIIATVRYDDECGNGHNSFAITGEIYRAGRRSDAAYLTGGCIHDEIAKAFPDLAPLLKWHGCSSDAPMHYVANTVYHAGDRDHNGLLKGEKRQLRNGRNNLPVWQRIVRNSEGVEVELGHHDWKDAETAPVETLTVSWEPVWTVGEGKPRDLDAARRCAVWPDATDEELTAPGLRERLLARQEPMQREFRAAVESLLGFIW